MVEPIKIQFRPGINRETTDYANTGGWFDVEPVDHDVLGDDVGATQRG